MDAFSDAPAPLATPASLASLGMYPFAELSWAYDALWADIHRSLPWTPRQLDRTLDVHDTWLHPGLVVSQTCGWPLVTDLRNRVRVLGSFRFNHPSADGYRYRSVIVARERRPLAEFEGERAAVNSAISLSGWISLIAAVGGPGASWSGGVEWTGTHRDSLRSLQRREAMVASLDSISFAHLRRSQPELLVGLHEVGHGPLVPTLPLITSINSSDDQVDGLRWALQRAARRADPQLWIDGFEALDLDDYLPVLDLGPDVSNGM